MICVDTHPRIARARAVERDAALFGGPAAVEQIYRTRYHAACALYAGEADPVRRAGILIDNNDLNHPFVRRATDCRCRTGAGRLRVVTWRDRGRRVAHGWACRGTRAGVRTPPA
jgi:hypothetical protein